MNQYSWVTKVVYTQFKTKLCYGKMISVVRFIRVNCSTNEKQLGLTIKLYQQSEIQTQLVNTSYTNI